MHNLNHVYVINMFIQILICIYTYILITLVKRYTDETNSSGKFNNTIM